jgi:membrane protease YdiL (CAAX protease family)
MARPLNAPFMTPVAAPVISLLLALIGAVAARLVVAGHAGVTSTSGGVAFAIALAGAVRWHRRFTAPAVRPRTVGWHSAVVGVGGAAVLCAGPILHHLSVPGGSLPGNAFLLWAPVVTCVAIAEESFLRGALWSAVGAWAGEPAALAVTTLAFGALHIPFYGLGVLPLDLSVGLLLGGLRQIDHGVTAPAIAHVLADLAGWWLR